LSLSPRLWGSALAVTLLGSLAAAAPAATFGRIAGPAAPLSVFVKLPLRNEAELDALIALQSNPRSPLYHHFLSTAQFNARYGATPDSLQRVAVAMRARGLAVADVMSQGLHVRGDAATLGRAFNVRVGPVRGANGRMRLATTQRLQVPVELARERAVVIGLGGRKFDALPHSHNLGLVPDNRLSAKGPYYLADFRESYAFPSYTSVNGLNATIGIVIAEDALDSDTKLLFDRDRYSTVSGQPSPTHTTRPVDGGAPFNVNSGNSFEASLDVQQSLGSAPRANLVLYSIPDLSSQSVFDAYAAVVQDNKADVISSSFGACEKFFTAADNGGQDFTSIITSENDEFKQGNAQGQTFLASSGDSSGLGCTTVNAFDDPATKPNAKFIPGVEEPADTPNLTAVGGTNLITQPPAGARSSTPAPSIYVRESERGDPEKPYDPFGTGNNVSGGMWGSGSGVSIIFPRPDYQSMTRVNALHRGVPDVSLQMGGCPSMASSCDPDDSASLLGFGGRCCFGVIGTSSSSPEFAGLLALRISNFGGGGPTPSGRLGNVNQLLYSLSANNPSVAQGANYRTGIPGFNGIVREDANPKRYYSQIVGLGTPIAANLVGTNLPLAGDPATSSNP